MIKLFIMDVDGTLTDGKIYMGQDGEIMKAFCAHDAIGVRKLPSYGITPIVITGRESQITVNRAKEMNITFVFQNVSNKILKLEEIVRQFQVNYDEIAYVGDDENDLECIKLCKYKCCPNNAIEAIKQECNIISKYDGGNGAVREIVEKILELQNKK